MDNILDNIQYFLYLILFVGLYMAFGDSFYYAIQIRKAQKTNIDKETKKKKKKNGY